MAIWLCRAGKNGEYEARFFEDQKIYFTFEEIDKPLTNFTSRNALKDYFLSVLPPIKQKAAGTYASQGNIFCNAMKPGDWVITPSKISGALHFAEISGQYTFDADAEESYRHSRSVKWFAKMRRDQFDQDILYSLGSLLVICNIKQEKRVKDIVNQTAAASSPPQPTDNPAFNLADISEGAISDYIIRYFKGHGLTEIIAEILKAKGFEVFKSPEGPDRGVDLLAAAGSLGFSSPKICVQVKSTDEAVGSVVLDQLIGTMTNTGAEYGLLVSWSGFKKSVIQDIPMRFFKVRLWDRRNIMHEFLQHYDKMSDQIKQKIPLKRIWVLDTEPDED